MVRYTYQDAMALGWDIPPALKTYMIGYGPEMTIAYSNSYVLSRFSGFYVPNMANHALYGVVGFIILVGTIRNFAHKFMHGRLPRPLRSVQTWLVKHLFLSSTVGTKALEPVSYIGARGALGRWTSFHIPPRIHGILAGGYVVINCILLVAPYRHTKPTMLYPSLGFPFELLCRNFNDRTGILSFGATPLVYILASRNSPISFLTGASYATLQIYHRWVARVVFMHAFLHSLGWTVYELVVSQEKYHAMFLKPYWNWGCVATAAGAVLVAFSIRRLRELSYETFLIGHILANIFWIVGCYYHVLLIGKTFLPYLGYIYAAVGIWAGERLIRLVSMLFINMSHFGRSKSSTPSEQKGYFAAEGSLVGTGDYIRLRLTPSHSWPKMLGRGGPGSHVFISSPGLKVYENHPFTIAWPAGMPAPAPSSTGSPNSSDKDLSLSKGASTFEETDIGNEHTFELILKSYSGYTKRLAQQLTDGVEHKEGDAHPVKPLKLIIEGPYGQGTRLEGFQSVILIAGGSGISATTAHLADLAKRVNEPGFNVERISIVWAIRQTGAVNVLIPYLLRLQSLLPSSSALSISIHYTEINNHFKVLSPDTTVQVHHGRPDVGAIVDIYLPHVREDEHGRVAVSSCGPSGLCDRTREAVKARLGGKNGVQSDELVYHEEAFTW